MNIRFFTCVCFFSFAIACAASHQAWGAGLRLMKNGYRYGWMHSSEEAIRALADDPRPRTALRRVNGGSPLSFYDIGDTAKELNVEILGRPGLCIVFAHCFGQDLISALDQDDLSKVCDVFRGYDLCSGDRRWMAASLNGVFEFLTGHRLARLIYARPEMPVVRYEEEIVLTLPELVANEAKRLQKIGDVECLRNLVKAVIDTGMNIEDFDEEFRHIIAPVARAILWPRQAVCVVCRLPLPGKERVLISEYLVGADEARRQVALVEAARAQYEGSTGAASEEEVHMTVRCEMPCELCKTNPAEVMVASADDEAFYNRSPREREQMKFFCKPCADCLCESD